NHTKILSQVSNIESVSSFNDNTPTLRELNQKILAFNLSNPMLAEEFLNHLQKKIIYEVSDDDKIIEELVELYKKLLEVQDNNYDKDDDSTEPLIINIQDALRFLEI
ncbi:5091_t:CDS:1, partial [Dentiscutata heterogama]